MKALFTQFDVQQRIIWSRTHISSTNYLTITQKIQTIYNYKNATFYENGILSICKDYEIDSKLEYKEDIFDETHFIHTSMIDNIATKDYKYFKIVFANGFEVIVTTWKEFLSLLLENK